MRKEKDRDNLLEASPQRRLKEFEVGEANHLELGTRMFIVGIIELANILEFLVGVLIVCREVLQNSAVGTRDEMVTRRKESERNIKE